MADQQIRPQRQPLPRQRISQQYLEGIRRKTRLLQRSRKCPLK
ncbi:hypothetical protein ACFTAO_19060 [Paenibacillus rhizoplanae]